MVFEISMIFFIQVKFSITYCTLKYRLLVSKHCQFIIIRCIIQSSDMTSSILNIWEPILRSFNIYIVKLRPWLVRKRQVTLMDI